MRLEELVATLSNPALYPGAAAIEVRQTHASAVFLTPTEVYKLKKPVELGFLDYSTPSKRNVMCRREVALNRRLAPDVYLGVEKLRQRKDGSLAIGGQGHTIDYLVHMRRLPDEQRLSAQLACERAEDTVRHVARRIARFHAEAPAVAARYGAPRILAANAADNFRVIADEGGAGIVQEMRAELEAFMGSALTQHSRQLRARAAEGRVRDGHGDLRCEHVYSDGGTVTIIDCIEFNRRYRYADVALDLAFLAMDLAALGYPDLTEVLIGEYRLASGDDIRPLMPLFCSYRATVRAKVAILRAAEPEFAASEREDARIEALRYLATALRFARGEARPVLALVTGLSGTGKSTVARLLQQVLPARAVSSDHERKVLGGLGPREHPGFEHGRGIYTAEMSQRVYARLLGEASRELSRGRSVILDATYRGRAERLAARELAQRFGAQFLVVECRAPEKALRARFARREREPDPWSDATWKTYLRQRDSFEPFEADEREGYLLLETEQTAFEQAKRLAGALMYPQRDTALIDG